MRERFTRPAAAFRGRGSGSRLSQVGASIPATRRVRAAEHAPRARRSVSSSFETAFAEIIERGDVGRLERPRVNPSASIMSVDV